MDKYKELELITKGRNNIILKAKINDRVVCLKKISTERDGLPNEAVCEIVILKQLNHKNIIQLYDVFFDDHNGVLVLESCGLNLKQYINGQPLQNIKELFYQLVEAVGYCHSNKIMHRDIKPENILIIKADNGNIIKLADFGLAKKITGHINCYSSNVVSLWYRSPELLCNISNYSVYVDIWSLGCVYYEMCTGEVLFKNNTKNDMLKDIITKLGNPKNNDMLNIENVPKWIFNPLISYNYIENIDNILYKMLRWNVNDRITANTLLKIL